MREQRAGVRTRRPSVRTGCASAYRDFHILMEFARKVGNCICLLLGKKIVSAFLMPITFLFITTYESFNMHVRIYMD